MEDRQPAVTDPGAVATAESRLRAQVETLERRLRKGDEQRRAMLHIMGDLNEFNKRLANQRKAMLHILADYEQDRRRLARQTERLDNSRRALLHLLQDSHKDKLRLESSRKAMIHIMGDLRETTAEMQRREQELRDKQEQLVQAGKLATFGELTTGVAHELNNPLTAVLGRAGLIERAESLAEAQRQAGKIREAASRAAKIAKGLSTFARSHPADRGPMNLNDLVRWATDFQEYQLAVDNIKVETDLDPGLPAIIGDHHELEQVLINLMLNAQHAMVTAQGSGALRLATRWAGEWVELRVEDDGPGIPPEVLPRIFDAFFTTKPVGEGTGLGLSIVQEIVTRHGGKVRVEPPESGKGTIVIVALPPMRSATAQKS